VDSESRQSHPLWLGVLALALLVPVTLPVPVLRDLVAERFGVSELATSLFMSINMIGAALAAPIAGMLGDRLGTRRSLIAGAMLADSLCFAGLLAPLSFEAFMAIRFVEGAAHIFALSLLLSLASSSEPESRRGRVMGLVGGGMLLGVAIGAPIGGLIGRDDPLATLRVGAAVLVGAAALAVFVLPRAHRAVGSRTGLREIVAAVRARPLLATPLVFAFADRFTVGFFTTTFSLYLRRIHELPPEQIGPLIAVFMLPFALLSYPFGMLAERTSRVALMCGGSAIYGVGVASLGFWPIGPLPVLMGVLGVMAAVMFVPSLLLTIELAPESARSTAIGGFNMAGSLGFIFGPLVGGAVSEGVAAASGWEAGYRAAFGVAGAAEILCAAIALPLLLRLRRSSGRSQPDGN